MKKVFQLVLIIGYSSLIFGQKKNTKSQDLNIQNQVSIYKNALKYNDAKSAIYAIHEILSINENSSYKDSLAILYYKSNNFISAHLVAKELLSTKPNNATLLEINAVSLKSLNATKEAIDAFEKLIKISNSRLHYYELALLQLSISRYVEALQNVKYALDNTEKLDFKLSFSTNTQEQQLVPLEVALHNLKGIILFELKDNNMASLAFDEALKLMPDFYLAIQNKTSITDKQKKK